MEFLELYACQSPKFIDIGQIGVSAECFIAVGLGAEIVVEIIFCHGSEKPWFIEVRFCADGLIEILDGEHIIFVIQCTPSDGQQSVCIKLCQRADGDQTGGKSRKPSFLHLFPWQEFGGVSASEPTLEQRLEFVFDELFAQW